MKQSFDRERLVTIIANTLGIPKPQVITGATVRSDFIKTIAKALDIENPPANTYRLLETVLGNLGMKYDPKTDASELAPTGGGGTITNHGFRKIARGIGAVNFAFILNISGEKDIDMDEIISSRRFHIEKSTRGAKSIFEAGEGSKLMFLETDKRGITFYGYSIIKTLGVVDQRYEIELIDDFEPLQANVRGLKDQLTRSLPGKGITEVSEQTLNTVLKELRKLTNEAATEEAIEMSDSKIPHEDKKEVPEEIEIRPETDSLRIYAGLTYTRHYAIGEFIDNSISSALQMSEELKTRFGSAYKLKIEVNFDRENKTLSIRDNAGGIAGLDLQSALRAGSTNKRRKVGLGVYGVGMKASAFWFGTELKIETFPLDEETGYTVSVDVAGTNHVADKVKLVRIPKNVESGTLITIGGIRGGIPKATTLANTKNYLASIYRDYLGKGTHQEIELDCEILFDGIPLEFKPQKLLNAPYWPNQDGPKKGSLPKEWKKEIAITLSTGENITGWVGILEQMSRFHSGFTLYYNQKAVTGAGMADDSDQGSKGASGKYKPALIFSQVGSKLDQSFIGDFDITKLGKTITTDKPNWTDDQEIEFAEKVLEEIKQSPESMYSMAKNYRRRPNQRSVPSSAEIENKDKEDLRSIEANLTNEVEHGPALNPQPFLQPSDEDIDGKPGEIRLHDQNSHEHLFKIRMIRHRDSELLNLIDESEMVHIIDINLDHPMFDDLEETDIDLRLVIRRFCIAIAATKVFLDLADGDLFINKLNLMFRTMAGKGIEDEDE